MSSTRRTIVLAAGLASFAGGTGSALAQSLPAASYYVGVSYCNASECSGTYPFPCTCHCDFQTTEYPSGTNFQMVNQAEAYGGTSPEAVASSDRTGGQTSTRTWTSAEVNYWVGARPIGTPPPGVLVPVHVTAALQVSAGSASNYDLGVARASVALPGITRAVETNSTTGGAQSLNVSETVYIDPAQPSQITAHAEVIVGPWSYPPGHIHEHSWGEALADPVFTIDPSWEYASQFQLVYSSNLGCYANCDNSTASPALNVADFSCFLQKYAAGDPYANCDLSTTPPVLNVQDFTCFLQKYSAGCP